MGDIKNMAHDSEQKIKLLVLYDILCRLTDENHALNTDELIEELGKQGIKASPRVLTRDIELLNSHGYEILSYICARSRSISLVGSCCIEWCARTPGSRTLQSVSYLV